MKRSSLVFGLFSTLITGRRLSVRGFSLPIASLRIGPRPASASPKPTRFCWIAFCVGVSKVLRSSSNSTGSGVALDSGITAPSA